MPALDLDLPDGVLAEMGPDLVRVVRQHRLHLEAPRKRGLHQAVGGQVLFAGVQSLEAAFIGRQIDQPSPHHGRVRVIEIATHGAKVGDLFQRMPRQGRSRREHRGPPGSAPRQFTEPHRRLLAFALEADQFDFSVGEAPHEIRRWAQLDGPPASAGHGGEEEVGTGDIVFQPHRLAARRAAIGIEMQPASVQFTLGDIGAAGLDLARHTVHFGVPLESLTGAGIEIDRLDRDPGGERQGVPPNAAAEIEHRFREAQSLVPGHRLGSRLLKPLAVEPEIVGPRKLVPRPPTGIDQCTGVSHQLGRPDLPQAILQQQAVGEIGRADLGDQIGSVPQGPQGLPGVKPGMLRIGGQHGAGIIPWAGGRGKRPTGRECAGSLPRGEWAGRPGLTPGRKCPSGTSGLGNRSGLVLAGGAIIWRGQRSGFSPRILLTVPTVLVGPPRWSRG